MNGTMKTSERFDEFMQGIRQERNTDSAICQSAGIQIKREHLGKLQKSLVEAGFGDNLVEPGNGPIVTVKVTYNMKDLDKLQVFAMKFKQAHQ